MSLPQPSPELAALHLRARAMQRPAHAADCPLQLDHDAAPDGWRWSGDLHRALCNCGGERIPGKAYPADLDDDERATYDDLRAAYTAARAAAKLDQIKADVAASLAATEATGAALLAAYDTLAALAAQDLPAGASERVQAQRDAVPPQAHQWRLPLLLPNADLADIREVERTCGALRDEHRAITKQYNRQARDLRRAYRETP